MTAIISDMKAMQISSLFYLVHEHGGKIHVLSKGYPTREQAETMEQLHDI